MRKIVGFYSKITFSLPLFWPLLYVVQQKNRVMSFLWWKMKMITFWWWKWLHS